MPEIPEIEGYRKQLEQHVVGQRIRDLHVQRDSWLNTALDAMKDGVIGRQILYVERRGTDLIFHLDDGRRLLLRTAQGSHLHIEQRFDEAQPDVRTTADGIHKAQLMLTTDNAIVTIHSARTGQFLWLTAKELDEQQKEQGPDPLSRHLTPERFKKLFAKRRSALKTALMNPNIIVGIDSHFTDDIAFAARLRPSIRMDQLQDDDWDRLYHAMVNVLQGAIEQGENGTANVQCLTADTQNAGEELDKSIHGKAGEPCPCCGTLIQEMMIQRRPAYYCPQCQPEIPPNEQ